jgi:hypothetical protein
MSHERGGFGVPSTLSGGHAVDRGGSVFHGKSRGARGAFASNPLGADVCEGLEPGRLEAPTSGDDGAKGDVEADVPDAAPALGTAVLVGAPPSTICRLTLPATSAISTCTSTGTVDFQVIVSA